MSSILGGQAANSWPSSFQVVGTQSGTLGTTLAGCVLGAGTCTPTTPFCSIAAVTGATNAGPYTCANPPQCTGTCTGFSAAVNYSFPYTITAIGQSIANEQQIVEDAGSLVVTATFDTSAALHQSFAAWGMFIDQFPECSGGYLVPGTITGPVFTNGAWTFGNTGSYTFTDKVGSVSPTFGWQDGSCTQSATYPQPGFSTTFQSTVTLGANAVPLPANDFNQKEAVVDGLGNQGGVTNAQMNSALKTEAARAYPSAGTTNPGVYMPYSHDHRRAAASRPVHDWWRHLRRRQCQFGGAVGGQSDHRRRRAQPAGLHHHAGHFAGHDDTITVDLTSNTTTMASQTGSGATTTTTINGVPENLSGTTPSEATMLYVDGEHQFAFRPFLRSGHSERVGGDHRRRQRRQHHDHRQHHLRDKSP